MIKLKSGIIPWNYENITRAPNTPGIFVLRAPDYSILRVCSARGSLTRDLKKSFKNISNIAFFDWYSITDENELVQVSSDWKDRYEYATC